MRDTETPEAATARTLLPAFKRWIGARKQYRNHEGTLWSAALRCLEAQEHLATGWPADDIISGYLEPLAFRIAWDERAAAMPVNLLLRDLVHSRQGLQERRGEYGIATWRWACADEGRDGERSDSAYGAFRFGIIRAVLGGATPAQVADALEAARKQFPQIAVKEIERYRRDDQRWGAFPKPAEVQA